LFRNKIKEPSRFLLWRDFPKESGECCFKCPFPCWFAKGVSEEETRPPCNLFRFLTGHWFEEVKRFDFCHGLIGHVIQKCQFFYCRWCSPWLGAAKCGGLVALNRWGAEVHSAGFCELTRRWDRLETLDTIHRL